MTEQIAIIETGGKQYLVKVGDAIKVEKLTKEKTDKLTFIDLLGNKKVSAKIIDEGKLKKVSGRIFRNKVRASRFPRGHRQAYTKLSIEKIA